MYTKKLIAGWEGQLALGDQTPNDRVMSENRARQLA